MAVNNGAKKENGGKGYCGFLHISGGWGVNALRQKGKVLCYPQPSGKVGQQRRNREISQLSLTLKRIAKPESGPRGLSRVNCSPSLLPHDSGKYPSNQIQAEWRPTRRTATLKNKHTHPARRGGASPNTGGLAGTVQQGSNGYRSSDTCFYLILFYYSFLFILLDSLRMCLVLAFISEALTKHSRNFGL